MSDNKLEFTDIFNKILNDYNAGKVESLKFKIDVDLVNDVRNENIKLKLQNEKLKDALKFYANDINWYYCSSSDSCARICSTDESVPDGFFEDRGGKLARQILKELEG